MSGRGTWSDQPPGTEDDILESNRNSTTPYADGLSFSHQKQFPLMNQMSSQIGLTPASRHGFTRKEELDYRAKGREDSAAFRQRSQKSRERRSRSSSSTRDRHRRRNRRSSNSSSSSVESRPHLGCTSKEKSSKHRRRSRSPVQSSKYKRREQDRRSSRSSSSSSSSTDRSRSRKDKYNRRHRSPVKRTNSYEFKSYNRHSKDANYNREYSTSSQHRDSRRTHESSYKNKELATSVNPQVPVIAPFKNDGSFLEIFKKMQESQKNMESSQSSTTSQTLSKESTAEQLKKPALPLVGKRRGGRVLKTGMVKKEKTIEEQTVDSTPTDAWSLYLKEVKKYRETSCEEEGKTRPLVK